MDGSQAKSGPPLIFVNRVLLGHTLLGHSRIAVRKTLSVPP